MVSASQERAITRMASAHLEVRQKVQLADYTTYKVGGPAALFIEVIETEALAPLMRTLHELELPWLVLGKGSNVLIADAGFNGAVVHLGKGFTKDNLTRDAFSEGVHRLEVGAALSRLRGLRATQTPPKE